MVAYPSFSSMVKSPKFLHILALSKSMVLNGTMTEEEWQLFHSSAGWININFLYWKQNYHRILCSGFIIYCEASYAMHFYSKCLSGFSHSYAQLRSLHSCSVFPAPSSTCGVSSCASVPPNLTCIILMSLMHWDGLDASWFSSAVTFWCIWQCLSAVNFVISVTHSMRIRILLGVLKRFWQRASGFL